MLDNRFSFLSFFSILVWYGSLNSFCETPFQKPSTVTGNKTNMAKSNPKLLNFLYSNRVGRFMRPLFTSKKYASCISSYFADSRFSRFFIKSFVQKYHINMDDFEIPAGGFKSFNQFFYRKLKPQTRQIDQEQTSIISPADSVVTVIENIQPSTTFGVKNVSFELDRFINNPELAPQFYGGTVFIFRLAPPDYHRFHFPCNGIAEKSVIIPGKFESVHPIVFQCGIQPLAENERHLIRLETAKCGTILCIAVGALLVGKIIETYREHAQQIKGDEMGYFSFGGSTLVLVFKKDTIQLMPFLADAKNGIEISVRMGQTIAHQL